MVTRFTILLLCLVAASAFGDEGMDQLNLGFKKQEADDFRPAISHFDRAIELVKDYAWKGAAYHSRARCYADLGELEAAMRDSAEAIRLKPNEGEHFILRGSLYKRQGQTEKALDDWATASRIPPLLASHFSSRGLAWYFLDQYEKAAADLTESIRRGFRSPSTFVRRAMVYEKQRLFERALTDVDEAIRVKTGRNSYAAHKAHLLKRLRRYDDALSLLNEALESNANDAALFHGRGDIYVDLGQFRRAIEDYDRSIQLQPTRAAYLARGDAHWNLGDRDQGLSDCDAALRIGPANEEFYLVRGHMHYRAENYLKAIEDCEESNKLYANFAPAYDLRGQAFARLGQAELAINAFETAIKLKPKAAEHYSNYAWALATLPVDNFRDGKRAVELATKACELSAWNEFAILDTLAASYAEDGDFEAATKWQAKAIELCVPAKKESSQAILELYRGGKPFRSKAGDSVKWD